MVSGPGEDTRLACGSCSWVGKFAGLGTIGVVRRLRDERNDNKRARGTGRQGRPNTHLSPSSSAGCVGSIPSALCRPTHELCFAQGRARRATAGRDVDRLRLMAVSGPEPRRDAQGQRWADMVAALFAEEAR